ncbi:MAG TPA: hypothetical protein VK826_07100 [Bacteroidia bacterium]|nr:hypothetical protein [Bacteroidia bacterium]
MTTATLQFVPGTPAVLTVFTRETPKSIRIILGVIVLSALLAPIVATISILASGSGLKFGLIVSYIISWAVGYYLLRVILWNTYGKEILTVEQDKFSYYCDYKYFKDAVKEIKTDQLQIEIIKSGAQNELGVMHFTHSTEKIEMILAVPLVDLSPVEGQIREIYTQPIGGGAHIN